MNLLRSKLGVLCVLCVLCGEVAAQIQLGTGVRVGAGVRFAKAETSAMATTLAQPVAAGTTSATFGQGNTVHNTIVVVVAWYDVARNLTGITDTAGNTYAAAAPQSSGTYLRQAIWYAKDIAAHAAGNVVTATWDGTPTAPTVRVMEFSGLDQTTPLDMYAAGSGTAQQGAPVVVATAAVETTGANELLVGAGISSYDFSAAGSSFTLGALAPGGIAEYRTVSTTGFYAADAWTNGKAQNWLIQLATFRAAGQTIVVTPPAVTRISPARGPTNSATSVTITGTDFLTGASVTIGGAACGSISVVSSTQITCTAPAHAATVADVVVRNPGSDPGTLSAAFTYGVYLTAALNPSAGGSVSEANGLISCPSTCSVLLDNGRSVSLTPAAGTGYVFANWNDSLGHSTCDSLTGTTCNVTMGSVDWTATANFTATNSYLISVSRTVNGASSSLGGTVTETSPNTTDINCGSICSHSYAAGTQIGLQAVAASGYTFSNWNDSLGHSTCDTPSGNTCTLSVGAAPWTVIANFVSTGGAVGDYYVSTSGSDSTGTGSSTAPWRTIQYAANTAPVGSTIVIRAGIYRERVTLSRSLTLKGEVAADGSYLTVIDPTVCVSAHCGASGSWASYGSGVWRKQLGQGNTSTILLGGPDYHQPFRIADCRMNGGTGCNQPGSGLGILQTLATATFTTNSAYIGCTLPYWDGIEAAYGYTSDGWTYFRFRDGRSPDTEDVYASGGHADGSGGSPTVTFNGSTSTLQNVWIRGSYVGVSFTGTGSSNSLKGSRVNGIRTIQVSGQHYVTIDNNDITANYYATSGDFAYSNYISHDFSEWEYAPKATTSPYCMANYLFSPVMKHIGGEGQGIEDMLGIYDLGGGNSDVTVSNNHIHGYDSGVFIGWKGASSNWETFGNRFENMTSNGINFGKYAVNAKFHDNSSGRINEHVRFQSLWNDPTPRSVYIYRNQFWFPSNVGQDFYFHYGPKVTTTAPAAYIYHNSFQGGNTVFGFGGGDPSTPQLGVPGFHAWNNVFSGLTRMWIDWTANSGADSAHWGRFGYSWMGTAGGTYGTVAWTGETKTYVTNGNMWPGTTPPKSWAPTGSAVGTAVDCSPGTWTLGSTTFGPMPGCTAGTTNMGAQ